MAPSLSSTCEPLSKARVAWRLVNWDGDLGKVECFVGESEGFRGRQEKEGVAHHSGRVVDKVG